MSKHDWTPWLAAVTIRPDQSPQRDSIGDVSRMHRPRQSQFAWQPSVDMFESSTSVVLRVDLPGVSAGCMALDVDNSTLLIHGERPGERETEEGVYQMLERAHGHFMRKVSLPDGLDVNRATAVLRDGLLTITIPKAASQGRRRIPVGG